MKTLSTITQRLQNHLRRPRTDQQQRVAGFETRLHRWKKAPQKASPANATHIPEDRAERKGRRLRLLQGTRIERTMDQLYEEVDTQAVVSLAFFHDFLDAEELLLDAREAETSLDDAAGVPIGPDLAAAHGASIPRQGRDGVVVGDSPHGQDNDDGWDEDEQAGTWENGSSA